MQSRGRESAWTRCSADGSDPARPVVQTRSGILMASVGVLFLLFAAAAGLGAQPLSIAGEPLSPYASDSAAVEAGRQLFVDTCSPCHGPTGEGGRGPSLVDGRQVRRASDPELFDVVKNGLRATDMPPSPFTDEQTWKVVAFLRSLSASAIEANAPGNVEAGSQLFWGSAGCSSCHSIRGLGGVPGPDLTDIGVVRRVDQLKESIVDPGARIADGFLGVEATKRSGQKIKGVAKLDTNYSLRLLDTAGRLHFLDKRDLTAVEAAKESLMPGNYAEKLSEDQVRDLVAYLSRQSIRGKAQK